MFIGSERYNKHQFITQYRTQTQGARLEQDKKTGTKADTVT